MFSLFSKMSFSAQCGQLHFVISKGPASSFPLRSEGGVSLLNMLNIVIIMVFNTFLC